MKKHGTLIAANRKETWLTNNIFFGILTGCANRWDREALRSGNHLYIDKRAMALQTCIDKKLMLMWGLRFRAINSQPAFMSKFHKMAIFPQLCAVSSATCRSADVKSDLSLTNILWHHMSLDAQTSHHLLIGRGEGGGRRRGILINWPDGFAALKNLGKRRQRNVLILRNLQSRPTLWLRLSVTLIWPDIHSRTLIFRLHHFVRVVFVESFKEERGVLRSSCLEFHFMFVTWFGWLWWWLHESWLSCQSWKTPAHKVSTKEVNKMSRTWFVTL